ncbi:S8 family serine peptidase [Nonomuraea aurantiaca]|uniref:S8 family serine peptidase n=1 Tax=Nonomuraea aurantiaca TaxID=2878562 RepID=UPI001CD9A1C8|nr:S8 family serine peptidase [Nonomuraea aurantiaca]MCA2226057.1 S8 family serine peptidase [Nonomuraea aurantiaca]
MGIPSVPLAGIYPSVLSGTSMAAPTVAGVAALVKDRYGDMSSSVVNALIIKWAP